MAGCNWRSGDCFFCHERFNLELPVIRTVVVNELSQQVLRTDAAGMPLEWINYQEAVRFYHAGRVAYFLGSPLYRLRGGINALTGVRSEIEVNAIVATHGTNKTLTRDYIPPLSNRTLFKRDGHVCLYCGQRFMTSMLSRDHVTPISKGGADTWQNVVTACKRCNNHKAGRTPEQAGIELLAIPFRPTHAEYIYLKGKRVLADQMDFLRAHFPRKSPLRDRERDGVERDGVERDGAERDDGEHRAGNRADNR